MKNKFKIEIRSGYVTGDIWYVVYIRKGKFLRRRWELLKTFTTKKEAEEFIQGNEYL